MLMFGMPNMFRDILVSIDGSAHSDQALSEAIDIAQAGRARLTLITSVRACPSWAYSPVSAGAARQLAAEFEREAHRAMRDAVARVPPDLPVTKIITHEPIRSALIKQIEAGNHDLLVMGSRGRGAVASSLLGSVSHHALNHSPIPVLIVHEREPSAPREAHAHARDNQPAASGEPAASLTMGRRRSRRA
jgi:nucleotide-binding universal stress UspA family protein